ncbi:hypothetical protein AN219_28150, partial [Streptomyces nanshensis]
YVTPHGGAFSPLPFTYSVPILPSSSTLHSPEPGCSLALSVPGSSRNASGSTVVRAQISRPPPRSTDARTDNLL